MPASQGIVALRERVIRWMSGSRGVRRTIHGRSFRVDAATRARFVPGDDAEVIAELEARIRPGDIVWNVGANVGVYALQLAKMVGQAGRVIAFEPGPLTAARLRRNVTLNHLASCVTIVEAGIADHEGTMSFLGEADSPMGRLGRANPRVSQPEAQSVRVTTLDLCAATYGAPAGVVMDIEGFEIAALEGARALLAAPNAPWMVVELHPDAWAWSGHTAEQLARLLSTMRLKMTPLTGQAHPLEQYGHVLIEQSC